MQISEDRTRVSSEAPLPDRRPGTGARKGNFLFGGNWWAEYRKTACNSSILKENILTMNKCTELQSEHMWADNLNGTWVLLT